MGEPRPWKADFTLDSINGPDDAGERLDEAVAGASAWSPMTGFLGSVPAAIADGRAVVERAGAAAESTATVVRWLPILGMVAFVVVVLGLGYIIAKNPGAVGAIAKGAS